MKYKMIMSPPKSLSFVLTPLYTTHFYGFIDLNKRNTENREPENKIKMKISISAKNKKIMDKNTKSRFLKVPF